MWAWTITEGDTK